MKMKKLILTFVIFTYIPCVSATTLTLTADKDIISVGETIKFHLEIHPTEPVGGNFAVYMEVSPKKFNQIRILYKKPSPGQCYTCAGDTPLRDDLSKNFYFIPKEAGNYFAEANFGNLQKRVNFTVTEITTTTTTTVTTTSTTTTSSTTTTLRGQDKVITIYFFYSPNCPYCAEEKPFLEELERRYPSLVVRYFEAGKNIGLFKDMCMEYDTIPAGVPRTFIGNKVFIGFNKDSGELIYHQGYKAYIGYRNQMELAVRECLNLTWPLEEKNAIDVSKRNSLVKELLKENPNSIATVTLVDNFYLVAWWTPQRIRSNLQYPDVLVKIDAKTGEIIESEIPSMEINGIEKPIQGMTWIHISILSVMLIYLISYLVLRERTSLEPRYWVVGFITLLIISGFVLAVTTPSRVVENFAKGLPFPMFVFVVALVDGFNPCAFTVLMILLSLLTYTRSRKRMCLIGSVFILTSGAMYFAFIMLIIFAGSLIFETYRDILMKLIGGIVIIAGIINIKDFFFFGKFPSLGIPENYRSRISLRAGRIVREVKNAESKRALFFVLIEVILLAIFVNLIELGCTAMLPMTYLAALFQLYGQQMSIHYYIYTAFYSLIYIIPLFAILGNFLYSFKSERLTERQGRILKLIGGLLMFILGILLIFKPELLMFNA